MEKQIKTPLVSVIVPVYNVRDYLDECLESIRCQTFKNIEILLLADNSTDGSTERCKEWCDIDDRIVFIRKKEKGLGAARNQGIAEAKGEYLVFIDSDDWIRSDYVEKLYLAITNNRADMAECDLVRMRNYEAHGSICKSSEILGKQFGLVYRWTLGQVSMCKMMTKRELWLRHKIFQPNTVGEDIATYPLLLAYAEKIVGVNECLYFYRKDRKGNICSQTDSYEKTIYLMKDIVQEFKERNIYLKYRTELMLYVRKWISKMLSPLLGRVEEKEYLQIRKKGLEIYSRCFDEMKLPSEFLWGGFNLTRIVNKLDVVEDPFGRFQFSSMIALGPHQQAKCSITHKNIYRKYMLEREFTNAFSRLIKKEKPEWFFFDLLEERHDIICAKDGYYTKSDAYDEAEINLDDDEYRIILRESEECTNLWKASCRRFMNCLMASVLPEKIYMIENYLTERHGDGCNTEAYTNMKEIQKINRVLNSYYLFIKENYPEIHCIKAYEVEDYYTDNEYEYGCYPWHLNEWANIRIAEKIKVI